MKYYVMESASGTTLFVCRGDTKVAGISLSMFKTAGECIDFANHLCNLLNADIEEPARLAW